MKSLEFVLNRIFFVLKIFQKVFENCFHKFFKKFLLVYKNKKSKLQNPLKLLKKSRDLS